MLKRAGPSCAGAALVAWVALIAPSAGGVAQSDEPCRVEVGAPPQPGTPPVIWVSSEAMLRDIAARPECDGSPLSSARLAVAVRGQFYFRGTMDDLLGRVGAISRLTGLRYWSVTDEKWETLVVESGALTGPGSDVPRDDFTAAELRAGGPVYYRQRDNRSSESVTYRMQVSIDGPSAATIDIGNVTAIRYLFITLFPPNAIHTRLRLRKVSSAVWELDQLHWYTRETNRFALGHEGSLVNRSVALYRHVIGVPSDQEPPAAR